jgi:peptidyl-prolyl cis-trans isomerase C
MNLRPHTIALIAVPLVVLATVCAAQQQVDRAMNPPVLKVNGETVYAAEISIVMQEVMKQMGVPPGQQPTEDVIGAATQRVIEQKLLAQEARRFGLTVNPSLIQQRIDAAARQVGGRLFLTQTLAAAGATLTELENFYRDVELGRAFISNQLKPTVSVTDAEIDTFLEDNPEFGEVEEGVRARQILMVVPQHSDLETDQAAMERADRAHARALAGEDFAELANEVSEGPLAVNGGDLGWFSRSRVIPLLAEAAFALEPGEISKVIRTDFGYHVIKVEARRPAGLLTGEELRERARTVVVNRKTADLVAELLKTLFDSAEIEDLAAE